MFFYNILLKAVPNLFLNFVANHYLAASFILVILLGELALIFFGILSSRHESMNFWLLLLSSSLSAIMSKQVIFLFSRFTGKIGDSIFKKYENHWFYSFIIARSTSIAICLFIFFRFFPVLRIASTFSLGKTKISTLTFTIVNIIVSIIWCFIYLFLGYSMGCKTAHIGWIDLIIKILLNYKKYENLV